MLLVRREVLYVLDICIGIGYMLSTIVGLYSANRDVCNLVLDICCQQLGDNILLTGIYVIWWVFVCPLGAGLGNVHFLEYTFVLDIHCQQLGNICHLNLYIGIGYIIMFIWHRVVDG